MRPRSVAPDPADAALLPYTNFMDCYTVTTDEAGIDAPDAAHRMFSRMPRWVRILLRLRNAMVAPFGVKSTATLKSGRGPRIGFFPVISQSPERVVLGLDDLHLDFRVLVDVSGPGNGRRQVTLTTLVKTHNLAGRAYLALIYPFHNLISRCALAQIESR